MHQVAAVPMAYGQVASGQVGHQAQGRSLQMTAMAQQMMSQGSNQMMQSGIPGQMMGQVPSHPFHPPCPARTPAPR